jgi:hypothetical protein
MSHKTRIIVGICRRTLVVAMALTASLAAMGGVASPALATPKGEFAVFADCPLSNPELTGCITAKTESGKFIIGNRTVNMSSRCRVGSKKKTPVTSPFKGKENAVVPSLALPMATRCRKQLRMSQVGCLI